MINAQPSINPADLGSMSGMMRAIMKKFAQGLCVMLPARVIAYDRDSNRAQVQPMIRVVTTQDQLVSRAQIASIPVFQIGGGGFILSYPIKPGNLGWVVAADRDMSIFLQGYTESVPQTDRLHSFEDSLFFPDPMTGYDIAEEDQQDVVLQNMDGSVKIKLTDEDGGGIVITAPSIGWVITGDDGTIGISSPNTINIISPTLQHNGVNIGDDHKHSGVTTGGGTTGNPI